MNIRTEVLISEYTKAILRTNDIRFIDISIKVLVQSIKKLGVERTAELIMEYTMNYDEKTRNECI